MKYKYIILLLIGLLAQRQVKACGGVNSEVYFGEITYSLDIANPLYCHVTINLYANGFENLATDSLFIDWGDGQSDYYFATSLVEDTQMSNYVGTPGFFKHVFNTGHAYAAPAQNGFYIISTPGIFGFPYIANIGTGFNTSLPFYLEALVHADTTAGFQDHSPVFGNEPSELTYVGNPYTSEPAISNPDGDSLVFALVPTYAFHANPVSDFAYPNQFCYQFGDSSSLLTIDSHTGQLTWADPCIQGTFSITFTVSEYRNGQFLGSIMRQQDLFVSNQSVSGINGLQATTTSLEVFPNPVNDQLAGTLVLNGSSKATADIIALDGSLLIKDAPINPGTFEIDAHSLPAGFYTLRVIADDQILLRKFVKQ